jgi:hypothetical protein
VTYLLGEANNGLVGWRILLLALDEEERAALVARCGCCDRSHWQLLDNFDDDEDANDDKEGAVVMTLPRKWMDRFAACKSWDDIDLMLSAFT